MAYLNEQLIQGILRRWEISSKYFSIKCLNQIVRTPLSFRVKDNFLILDQQLNLYFQDFLPIIRLLLSHQSMVDGAACLFAMILLLQPPNWVPGVPVLDHVICHLWNAQFIYWCFVFISGWFSQHQLSDYSDISLIILYWVFMF